MWERIKLITSDIWQFIRPIVLVLLSEAGKALASSAIKAVSVTAENMSGASGAEKRDAAYRLIVDDLQQQGIQLGASTINTAIELAVQKALK